MSAKVMIIVKDPFLDLIPPLSVPAAGECPVFEPFRCPKEGLCISIQVEIRPYLHTIFFCQISTFAMELLTVWMLMMKIRDSARQVIVN